MVVEGTIGNIQTIVEEIAHTENVAVAGTIENNLAVLEEKLENMVNVVVVEGKIESKWQIGEMAVNNWRHFVAEKLVNI